MDNADLAQEHIDSIQKILAQINDAYQRGFADGVRDALGSGEVEPLGLFNEDGTPRIDCQRGREG